MASLPLQDSIGSASDRHRGVQFALALVLSTWFVLVVSLGAAGAFIGLPHRPPAVLGIAIATPLLLFWTWTRVSRAFRDFVLSLDLRLITGMQGWRWAGFGFLALYAHKLLPAVFAFPAGLGDMAVAMAAPWMVLALQRQPAFATSKAFIRWNLLGMLDLVIAVGIGTLSAMFTTGAPGEISTGPMATLPLLLIPAFFVPIFFMLHVAALMQSRQLARSRA